ncbi:MAG: CapA family protein [Caldilineaceae bacterium]|nr:CapA family protein [Caldilineaceae bacterium]
MTDVQAEPAEDQQEARSTAADDTDSAAQTDTPPTPTPEPTPVGPLAIAIDERVPVEFQAIIEQLAISGTIPITIPSTSSADVGAPALRIETGAGSTEPIYRSLFAVAGRFDTVDTAISADAVYSLWQGSPAEDSAYTHIAVISETLPSLVALMGEPGPLLTGYTDADAVLDAVWTDQTTLTLIPFHQLTPELSVLAVDGQTPVENDNLFDVTRYPFIVDVYAQVLTPTDAVDTALAEIATQSGGSNRRSDHLTVIAMTGVTAMVRLTAQQMDQNGPLWAVEYVSDTLAAADLAVISNEVPFVPGCTTNTSPDNLTFCSPPEYMPAFEAMGVDLIGLTGNHQNDYGRDDALISLDIYEEAGLPVYGGGRNKEAAFKPLYIEHNSNRLAFLGANSYGPPFAWATDNGPGSAEFDLNIMSATIRAIKERDLAEVVLAELQYQESYDVTPLFDQRQNFRALSRTGADIVTGVQSHVPQAFEFEDGAMILYGLGNFLFDQMQGTTREGMVVKHTIYQNRHISTQVFTTLIYDYGQPRWTTGEERATTLDRVFGASFWDRPRP